MDNKHDLPKNDFPEDIPPLFQRVLGSLHSRRVLLGTGLGFAAGAVSLRPEFYADSVDAAPDDVKGSPNVAVKSFSNKRGHFRLFSDGSIVDKDGTRSAENPNSRWDLNSNYKLPNAVTGKPVGSPWVAVDVVQDTEGTHILYADGSVRSPRLAEASAPPVGQLQVYTFFRKITGEVYTRGITGGGSSFSFETPFRETPKYLYIDAQNDDVANYWATDHPTSVLITTKAGFSLPPSYNQLIVFIGEVEA